MTGSQITIGERIFAAAVSALIMAVMALCIPIGVFVLSRGRGLEMLSLFGSFHIWGMSLIIIAGFAGAALGTDSTLVLYGHLWATEEPKKPALTFTLWMAILTLALCSYWMFDRHHVL
jgi:hypothetical protein